MVRVTGVEDGMLQENVITVMQMGTVGHQEGVVEEMEVFTVMLQGIMTGVTIVPAMGHQGIVELLIMT